MLRSLLCLLLLAGCPEPPPNDDDTTDDTTDDDDATADDDDATGDDDDATGDDDDATADDDDATGDDDDASGFGLPVWDDNPCSQLPSLRSGVFDDVVAKWEDQDAFAPPPTGQVVFVGSSSIRLWERLAEDFSAWHPIQRGFGGSIVWDAADHADALIADHAPRAVVLYAGTNDISGGRTVEQTWDGYRCLLQILRLRLGDVDVVFLPITPNPFRWPDWPESSEYNLLAEELAQEWSSVHYVDAVSAFLQTGSPPTDDLFQSDGLHLNEAGYALWTSVIEPALAAAVPPGPNPPAATLPPGTRILIDLGPSNPEDGEHTASPDVHGNHWNNWHPMEGESPIVAGEHLSELVNTDGDATDVALILSTSLSSNGILNGGLTDPDPALLGDLAVGTATQDYVWVAEGALGAFSLAGLDPLGTYTVRIFGSRASSETRVTSYTWSGAHGLETQDLQISGAGIGSGGGDGNDSAIAEFTGLQPDAAGRLHLDFETSAGSYAYVGILELIAE